MAANQTVPRKPRINSSMDHPNCHQGTVPGTPYGMRAIMTIGELKGIRLPQTAIGPVGLAIAVVIKAIEMITSIVTGKLSDWASRKSSFTALPMAA